jgi:hypothetical protein
MTSYCGKCQRDVSVGPILKGQELLAALTNDQLVRVGHVAMGENHTWNLGKSGKLKLLGLIKGRRIKF